MIQQLEAIWQDGVLRPLQPLDLQENQRVSLTVQETADEKLLGTDYLRYLRGKCRLQHQARRSAQSTRIHSRFNDQ